MNIDTLIAILEKDMIKNKEYYEENIKRKRHDGASHFAGAYMEAQRILKLIRSTWED